MAAKVSAAQYLARAEAYQEAAGHLNLSWSDDELEIAEGRIISTQLYAKAESLFLKAAALEEA